MEKYSWNFDNFFKSDNDFCKEMEMLKKDLDKFNNNLTSLSLSIMLEEYYKYSFRYEKLQTYTTLKYDVDMSNQKYLEYKNIVYEENSKLNKILNIIDEKIYEIDEPLDKYLEKKKELKAYKMHLYEVLRFKLPILNLLYQWKLYLRSIKNHSNVLVFPAIFNYLLCYPFHIHTIVFCKILCIHLTAITYSIHITHKTFSLVRTFNWKNTVYPI